MRADQSGRRADRIERNHCDTGELGEPARRDFTAKTSADDPFNHTVPSGTGAVSAADDTDACSAGDATGSAADASGRADTACAAFTAADSPAGSTSAGDTGRTQQLGSEVRHTAPGAAHAAPGLTGGEMTRYRSLSITFSVKVRRPGANWCAAAWR